MQRNGLDSGQSCGNTIRGHPPMFNWTIPKQTQHENCVIRIRSHTFAVRPVPEDLEIDAGAAIRNLNVRGKRENFVQVFPAVGYDYVPNVLEMAVVDFVHIQWTGSNTNPNNNAGQGLAGSDRSNIVLLKSQADAITLAYCDPGQFRGEVFELDDAGTYFNLPPRKVTQQGTYHYMSTRNNNFSNRDQKGQVIISTNQNVMTAIGWLGGNVTLGDGLIKQAKVEEYSSSLDFAAWSQTDADIRGGMAREQAQRGGFFVARSHSKFP
ncbi:protein dd3-3-like [Plakobranchus ocellatus]|uniref:Protein dd3-3-like n=1 Tax=Plakobranchus ocellatus TaxID=259542 RepID=A0AAV4DK52_9GAST|nr:protein dd3-3-like [Plakobranchus ocellatus]